MKRKILFLANPVSGIRGKEKIHKIIQQLLDKNRFDYTWMYTSYAGHGQELARQAVKDRVDAVVVVGGDGSVNEVASALVHTGVALGIIPCGSGNGFARHMKIPLSTRKCVKMINRFQSCKVDTFMLNNSFACNIAGVGFDARVAHRFAEAKKRGFWTYLAIILKEYPRYRSIEVKLETEEAVQEHKAMLVSVANGMQFGNGAVIAPHARISDGWLDICILSRIPFIFAPLLGVAFMGRFIHKTPLVKYLKVKNLKIISEKNLHAHIDGDPFPLQKHFEVKIQPLSLKVLMPGHSDRL